MSEDEKPQEQPDEEFVWPPKPNPEHLAILKSGVGKWNAWREEHPEIRPELQGADLHRRDLQRANLQEADLVWAELQQAILAGAKLQEAKLGGANLEKSILLGAKFEEANLLEARLREADLTGADLQEADLLGAKLEGASLDGANIAGADLSGARVKDTSFQNVKWRPEGGGLPDPRLYRNFDVRGLRFSDPLFDQFVRQSEFIRRRKEEMTATRWGGFVFHLWKWTCDCGRSARRWLGTCAVVIAIFALVFEVCRWAGRPLVSLGIKRPHTPVITNLYFSMVTFSTLGFGDVTPCNWIGELAVMAEVFLGYVLLGGLITILAMKLVPPR